MEQDLKKAAALLQEEDYTCVLCRDAAVYTSRERGVKPLLSWLDAGIGVQGFSAADRVVGKGAAFLYVILGIRAVYARVISETARAVLEENGITVQAETCVPRIFNRMRTGFCPIESAVQAENDPEKALPLIRARLRALADQK